MIGSPVARKDEGSALVIALVFTGIWAIVIFAVLGLAEVGFKLAAGNSDQRDEIYAADGAIEAAISHLAMGGGLGDCPDFLFDIDEHDDEPAIDVEVICARASPVITLTGADQEIEVGSPYVELGATALDSLDGDLTGSIVIDSAAVDVNTVGSYLVTYDVTDSSGNPAATVTRTVNVVDNTAPVITLTGADQTIGVGSPYVELGATALDNLDGDLTGSIVINAVAVDTSTVGPDLLRHRLVGEPGSHRDPHSERGDRG